MKRLISISLFLCLLLSVQAQKVYTTDNIPKVHLQNKMRYVCNPDGILSQAACDSIDRMLYALEQQTGIETVVAVVPSIGNDDCFDFAHRLLNEWGVGKKGKNNGLVILLVTDQRCIQFYTGYGLEGDLPDAICKRIQTRDMIPYLKDGNWDAGMVAGVRAVCGRLDGSMVNDTDDEEDILRHSGSSYRILYCCRRNRLDGGTCRKQMPQLRAAQIATYQQQSGFTDQRSKNGRCYLHLPQLRTQGSTPQTVV